MKLPFALITLSIATTLAADWPQWRGPKRDGITDETGLLKQWPSGGPKQAWVYDKAGMGYAGFSVASGGLFTMGTRDGKEILLALNAATGKEVWATPIGDILGNGWGDGPRSTPTVDGTHIYAMSGKGNLVCAEMATGKIVWTKSMKELGGNTPGWGFTESPLVDGDVVICTPGGSKGTIAALKKATGELVWQSSEVTEDAQYSSIVPATIGGKKQFVQLVMQTLFSIDPSNGKLLWRSDWPGRTAVIPTPVVKGDEVFVTSGYGVGCKKVKIASGSPQDVFMNKDLVNHHGGVILLGDHLYGHSDKGGWTCMNWVDGSVKWQEKSALGKGAISYADGSFYCLGEKDGAVVLIDASPTGWKEKGRFTLSPQSPNRNPKGAVWVHPVIANGRLYLRDQEYIHCYEIK